MANTNIASIGQYGAQWYIDGLSYLWDTDQYNYAYVAVNGNSTSPVYPPSPIGSGYTTGWGSISGLQPNTTYTAYGYVNTPSGTYATGSYTFTTLPPPRPSNFSWTYSKTSGGDFNLLASEWNNLISKVNDFRQYKGLSSYSFTTASSGADFAAFYFNQAVTAISAMSPPTSSPSSVSSGQDIYASYLNGLVDSLNSIS